MLSDEVKAGKGRDASLNDRVVSALRPDIVGTKPDILHDWNALMTFKNSLPGVKYRIGWDRLGVTPKGESNRFEVAISTDHGVNRYDPISTTEMSDDAERRTFLAALLKAKGL